MFARAALVHVAVNAVARQPPTLWKPGAAIACVKTSVTPRQFWMFAAPMSVDVMVQPPPVRTFCTLQPARLAALPTMVIAFSETTFSTRKVELPAPVLPIAAKSALRAVVRAQSLIPPAHGPAPANEA